MFELCVICNGSAITAENESFSMFFSYTICTDVRYCILWYCVRRCIMMFLFTLLLLQAHGIPNEWKRKIKYVCDERKANNHQKCCQSTGNLSFILVYCIRWLSGWAGWLNGVYFVCVYVCIVCVEFVAWSDFEW